MSNIPPFPQADSHPQTFGRASDSSVCAAYGLQPNPEVKNQWFNGQTLKLDGWHFISCRFDNCKLFVSTPYFFIEGCLIDASTIITYSPELLEVVRLFNYRNTHMKINHPNFCPRFNADGTMTVGGK